MKKKKKLLHELCKEFPNKTYREVEKYRGKKQRYKSHEHFHYRGEIKIAGKESEISECKECHRIDKDIN